MINLKKFSNSLEETLKDSNLHNVSVGLAEVVLDSLYDDGLIKDIPIIGSVVGALKVAHSIKERIFLKKIIYFISEIKNIPPGQRKQMVERVNESGEFRTKVGEKLLFIIDRCDDHEKSQIIAKIFTAFIFQAISYKEFLRASSIVDRILLEDLLWFVDQDNDDFMFEELGDLINTGLFNFNVEDQRDRDLKLPMAYELRAHVSEIGSKIRSILTKHGRLG